MQPTVVKECLDIFIKTLQLLYQPDCDNDCKQNVREFLEFLHDYYAASEGMLYYDTPGLGDTPRTVSKVGAASGLKEFVYNSIKYFAEQNQKAYQGSNLITLMNKVVDQRRGDIFDDQASVSSLNGGLSGRGIEDKSFVRNETHTLTNLSS